MVLGSFLWLILMEVQTALFLSKKSVKLEVKVITTVRFLVTGKIELSWSWVLDPDF